MDLFKIEAVSYWKQSTTVTEVNSFSSVAEYYRRFVEGFFKPTLPLTRLALENIKFSLTLVCKKSFQELKERLTTAFVLTITKETT